MRRCFLSLLVATALAAPAWAQEPEPLAVKLPPEEKLEDASKSHGYLVYSPARPDGSRSLTPMKDAVGKRVRVEGIAWGQPFGKKGEEGTISPYAGPRVVFEGGSLFARGLDFTETKARGKTVRVTGILRRDEGFHSRFGDGLPYYYLEAKSFDVIEAVTDPSVVFAGE